MARILVVGSIHMDFVVTVPRLPQVGETVLGKDFVMKPGGKGANQAVAASRLGAETFMVSRVGADDVGKRLLENLEGNRVSTRYVVVDEETHSGVAFILVDSEGRNVIAVAPGVDDRVSVGDVDRALRELKGVGVLLLQLEIPLETVVYAAKAYSERGVTVILNPAPYKSLPREIFPPLYAITPNRVEAEQMTGVRIETVSDCRVVGRRLLSLGVKVAVITLGAKGAYVVSEEFEGLVEGFEVPVVDTTGAGDAFNGALAVALAEGLDIAEAVKFANATAALKVTKLGAQEGLPSRDEVAEFLKKRGVNIGL